MTVVSREHRLDHAGLLRILTARADIVVEERTDDDPVAPAVAQVHRWFASKGPFETYHRTVEILNVSTDTKSAEDATYTVRETTDYKIALPFWWPYIWLLMRRAIASTERDPRKRWWWPREVVNSSTTRLLGYVGTIGMISGYLGVLISQTLTYSASEFEADDAAQSRALAVIRVGVLVSFVLLGLADRIGRRKLALWFTLAAILLSAAGGLVPSLGWLVVTQAVARGLNTGLLTLVPLMAAEQVPADSRAIAISFTTVSTGFGSALVVWALPFADTDIQAWRGIYLVSLLFLPLLAYIAKRMPETRRFVAAQQADRVKPERPAVQSAAVDKPVVQSPVVDKPVRVGPTRDGATIAGQLTQQPNTADFPGSVALRLRSLGEQFREFRRLVTWSRFALVGAAALLSSIFLSPASQLRNEFLRDDLGFSGANLTVFQILVSVPATLSIPLAGVLAERYGRRPVGSIALVGAAISISISYQVTGAWLFLFAALGTSLAVAAFPPLRGYQTELFPTRIRAKVGGTIDVLAVSGSVIGLLAAGYLVNRWSDLGSAIAALAWAPLVVVLLIILFFPETSDRELEDLNPDDPKLS